PSGALHFGSLLAALASYLDARAHRGQWLVRMEDLDPAREPPGAADQILRTLEAFGLHWDGQIVYQSQRQAAYFEALEQLQHQSLTFPCTCSRKRIKAIGGVYDGKCRQRQSPPRHDFATRLKVTDEMVCVADQIQGDFAQNLLHHCGDFILQRRDGLIAYQLAVVVDDAWQQVTDIVRGYDLLDSTPRQVFLQRLLGYPAPEYAHIPVAANDLGQKLSKQHFARPLLASESQQVIYKALEFLGQLPPPELASETTSIQIDWAIEHWDIHSVPKLANIPVSPMLS
ncbi:MAG TPA: tRNA glutamyl-Q(34) synthetase GluQRS, partial [Pseudohongiella sp.]|nr:tRNA glutamyl-Q(34) synthetase GluQRS [Pseudohongiella sp.]